MRRILPIPRAVLAATAVAILLTGCAAGPTQTPPPAQGASYTTTTGATVTVSGRVRAEGMTAR